MALNYLLDPMFQIENSAGKPATDGWLEVYIHGTRTKYYCASNFDGTLHPFKIKLDSLGSNIVLADDGQAYDVYAYNRFGSLLMSRYNVQPGSGGSGSIITGEMQHWLGMYGPTYTHFPGDNAGHTLGIPRQSVDYDGDFIDHIETAPYPDGDVPAYIYLKPGLYHIDCVIRYQQDSGDIKNTLDEVLIYTGHGNANEDVAYQLDASGPDTNGNRHCLKQSFIRKVTENDGSLLYFAPGTPTDWTDAYIQTLSIVKLDSMIYGKAGIPKVTHDDTMTGDGTPDSPLSIQDALDGKQDTLTPGEGITIDSDGNISSETYSEGWGIDIDENNVISVDPDIIQQKLTPGEGINIDSDGNISANEYTEGWGIDIDENNVISVDPDIIQQKLTPGDGIQIDSDGTITAEGEKYYEGWGIDINENNEISVDPDIIQKKITAGEGLTLDSDGNLNLDLPPIIPLVAGDGVTLTDSNGELIISAEGRQYTAGEGITIDGNHEISIDTSVVQEKLTAGQNINIDSDGVISADVPEQEQADWGQENTSDPSYIRNKPDLSVYQKKLTAGDNITIDSDGVISAEVPDESNVFVAKFNVTTYDEVKAAIDAGKAVIALNGRTQYNVVSSVTEMWGAPCVVFGAMADQAQSGYPKRSLYICRKLQDESTDWHMREDASIALKSDLDAKQDKLTAGQNITIDSDGVISATDEGATYTAGNGISIDGNNEISVDTTVVQEKLTAGQNITIDSDGVISAAGAPTYTAGNGINIDGNNEISVDTTVVQEKLTAGQNIEIDSDGTISAELPSEEEVQFEELDPSTYATKAEVTQGLAEKQDTLTAGQNITIDPNGVISAAGAPTYTAGNGINIDGNNEISVDTTVVQEKLTAGQNIEIDSDGTINAELPSEEEVTFEEFDPDDYQTKLTAGQNITIDPNGVISATSEPCLWFLDSDGKITPKDGKHFEVYGAPSYSQVGQYYFKKAAKVQSNDSGFEIDGLLASHTGSGTQYGNYGTVAKVYTEFAQDPYMGARRGGLIVKSFENSSVHPESRIDMYAGNDSGYGVENYKNKTYVQAVVGSDYVRMRSDDIVRHVGNSDSHAPFVSAQQTDTTKTYVMKPTSTTGVYDLVEESSGGGGGTTYTAGQGIDITNDVISVDSDSVAMKSDLPSEEEVEFEEFNPENFTQQQINAMKRVLGVDETVLFDGALPARNNTITLSEPFSNFEFVDVTYGGTNLGENPITFRYMTKYCGAQQVSFKVSWAYNYIHEAWIRFTSTSDNKVWTYASNTVVEVKNSGTAAPSVTQNDTSYITSSRDFKIVGVRRISNS